jgi:hypothetical protein
MLVFPSELPNEADHTIVTNYCSAQDEEIFVAPSLASHCSPLLTALAIARSTKASLASPLLGGGLGVSAAKADIQLLRAGIKMRKLKIAFAAALAVCAVQAHAATLEVGAGKRYTTLSSAAAAANSYDTIVVYPGTYAGATWSDSNLTIKRAAGTAAGSVVIKGRTQGDKGLFLIRGANITVDGLRFVGARSTSGNGAGIRQEGLNLTVRNSSFYDNEMAILATPYPTKGGSLTVTASTFDYNKSYVSGRLGHSIYGNSLDKLTVTNSKFTRNFGGHYIKSRALATVVTGNNIDDTDGGAAYLIDLPEGGAATIANNILVKGANPSNCCTAIAYGFEMAQGTGYQNVPGTVSIKDNKFTNKRASSVAFVGNKSTPSNPVYLWNNTLTAVSGSVKPLSGAGSVDILVM